MKRLLLAVALGAFLLTIAKGDEDEAAKNRCIESIGQAFTRLNAVLGENKLAPLSFDPMHLEITHNQDLNPAVTMWMFQTPQKTSIYCSPASGKILSFFRNDINYIAGPGYEQPPQPSWTQERAIAAAKTYFEALFGPFPKNVGSPRIKYEPVRQVPKYYPGLWHIRWPRIDTSGHLFGTDSIAVYISERDGLTSAIYNFYSTYQAPRGPLISRDEALKIGGPVAQNLANKWIGGGLQLATPDTIMQAVVNPNQILEAKTIQDAVNLTDTNARLVWFINYPLTANGVDSPHQVQVWIDAETKEVVGGDLH